MPDPTPIKGKLVEFHIPDDKKIDFLIQLMKILNVENASELKAEWDYIVIRGESSPLLGPEPGEAVLLHAPKEK